MIVTPGRTWYNSQNGWPLEKCLGRNSESYIFAFFQRHLFVREFEPDDAIVEAVGKKLLNGDKRYSDALFVPIGLTEDERWEVLDKEYDICNAKLREKGLQ